MNESTRLGLSRIICERALAEFGHTGLSINDLEQIENIISSEADIPAEKVRALLWAERPGFEYEESSRLAEVLCLHRDLFSCLVQPTSMEILSHVLHSIAAHDLDSSCEDCLDMADWIRELSVMESEEIGQLCLDLLGHLFDSEEALSPERIAAADDEETLLGVFRSLDSDARARVLAYTFSERGGTPADPAAGRSYAYARMRDKFLSPLACAVFDELARTPDGTLSASHLAARLGLSDARSIGQVPRSLQRCLREMKAEGLTLEEAPLLVRRSGRQSVYTLSPLALQHWKNLVEAAPGLFEKAPEA